MFQLARSGNEHFTEAIHFFSSHVFRKQHDPVMGIKGLQRYITKTHSQSIHPYMKYSRCIFAIDANILLYKCCYSYSHSMTMFINFFVHKIASFLCCGIFPVFIFDGEAPDEKKQTILQRNASKKMLKQRLEEMRSTENKTLAVLNSIRKLEKQCFNVTRNHRQVLVELLNSLLLPHAIAMGEAETLCAVLQRKGIVHYTLSDDTDALVYGCDRTVHTVKGTDRYLMETDLDRFLVSQGIDREGFLNACILSGCDYLSNLSCQARIDVCIDFVKRYGTLEEARDEMNKNIPMHPIEEYNRVKDIYTYRSDATRRILDQCDSVDEDISRTIRIHSEGQSRSSIAEALSVFLSCHGMENDRKHRYITDLCDALHCFSDYQIARNVRETDGFEKKNTDR